MTRRLPGAFRSDTDVRPLSYDMSQDDIIDALNKLINQFNFTNKFLSLQANFDGNISTVTIKAGTTVKIEHFLGVTPKWRVILRQEGNGVISDIPSGWTDKLITIKNNGAEDVTLSLLIARE